MHEKQLIHERNLSSFAIYYYHELHFYNQVDSCHVNMFLENKILLIILESQYYCYLKTSF